MRIGMIQFLTMASCQSSRGMAATFLPPDNVQKGSGQLWMFSGGCVATAFLLRLQLLAYSWCLRRQQRFRDAVRTVCRWMFASPIIPPLRTFGCLAVQSCASMFREFPGSFMLPRKTSQRAQECTTTLTKCTVKRRT